MLHRYTFQKSRYHAALAFLVIELVALTAYVVWTVHSGQMRGVLAVVLLSVFAVAICIQISNVESYRADLKKVLTVDDESGLVCYSDPERTFQFPLSDIRRLTYCRPPRSRSISADGYYTISVKGQKDICVSYYMSIDYLVNYARLHGLYDTETELFASMD